MTDLSQAIDSRRTFAIISHPDAGKTTITEKLLLLGNAIQVAGSVKGKKGPHATSDWMSMEQERGISVTSSVMQFPYRERVVNLLDTPGHEDFSEDTYRTLTAVDSALMVIDGAKGVEERTIKLMNVCRLRDTPIISFVNKLDRDIRDPVELLDEIEEVLKIAGAPINWPMGMGVDFKGVYNLYTDTLHRYTPGRGGVLPDDECIEGLDTDAARELLGDQYEDFCEEIELVRGASHEFDIEAFLAGRLSPVFFGTALGNFGVREMLDYFVQWAPPPLDRPTTDRAVGSARGAFQRFCFQDTGQHGSQASRPHRFPAGVLRVLPQGHEDASRAHRQRCEDCRRGGFQGRGEDTGRSGGVRRYHRPAQPRHYPDWRHLHGGGRTAVYRYSPFRPGDVPAHPPRGPDEVQAVAARAAAALRGGLHPGVSRPWNPPT